MKDISLEDENANILAVLNSIILKKYVLWTKAMNSTPQDFPDILKTSSAMETCVEIARSLRLKVIEPLISSQIEELIEEDINSEREPLLVME